MSPELLDIPSLALRSNSSFSLVFPTSLFLRLVLQRGRPTYTYFPLFPLIFILIPFFLLALFPRPDCVQKNHRNQSIDSIKCPSATAIVIERHNRLFLLSPLLSFPFFSLRDPSNWLRTSWASGGELHRDERAEFERASPRPQRDFSSFPIGRQTHSRLNILKTTGSRRHSIEQPTIVHHQTSDLFDVFVDSRGSMVPISALRKFSLSTSGIQQRTIAIVTMKSSF